MWYWIWSNWNWEYSLQFTGFYVCHYHYPVLWLSGNVSNIYPILYTGRGDGGGLTLLCNDLNNKNILLRIIVVVRKNVKRQNWLNWGPAGIKVSIVGWRSRGEEEEVSGSAPPASIKTVWMFSVGTSWLQAGVPCWPPLGLAQSVRTCGRATTTTSSSSSTAQHPS